MKKNIRLIARLDIKGPKLIKGIRLEGVRVVGIPSEFSQKYYDEGIDELIYMDSVASLYNRNSLGGLVKKSTDDIFIPLTVGGGVRSIEDVQKLLESGADKVALNTAAINRPELIKQIAEQFGSQCAVVSIEAIKQNDNSWKAFTDNGREHTGRDVVDWVKEICTLGCGEILLTSVDKEGTKKGFDIDLMAAVNKVATVPVIASGGFGHPEDIVDVVNAGADAVAIAGAFHYNKYSIKEIKEFLLSQGITTRHEEN
jgi:cyclase